MNYEINCTIKAQILPLVFSSKIKQPTHKGNSFIIQINRIWRTELSFWNLLFHSDNDLPFLIQIKFYLISARMQFLYKTVRLYSYDLLLKHILRIYINTEFRLLLKLRSLFKLLFVISCFFQHIEAQIQNYIFVSEFTCIRYTVRIKKLMVRIKAMKIKYKY